MIAAVAAIAATVKFVWNLLSVWKHKDPSRIASPALVVIGFGLGLFLGHSFREWNFNHNLERYNRAAKFASTQARDDQIVVVSLPDEFSNLATTVHVHKSRECGLMVDFFWGGGFPVKHIVRRYAQNPEFTDIPACRKSWSSGRQLTQHWFELRD
jgi:uncharacterized protein with PQ loop repeat